MTSFHVASFIRSSVKTKIVVHIRTLGKKKLVIENLLVCQGLVTTN